MNGDSRPVPTIAVPPAASAPRSGSYRWWLAVLVSTLFSLPTGWLLSYGATLMLGFGLFFFVLFGLLLGAVAFRIGSPGRPYGWFALLTGTTVIVVACWAIAVVKEVREVPSDTAMEIVRGTRMIGDRTAAEFRTEVEDQMHHFLAERFPPGGMVGTVRWLLVSGELGPGDLPLVQRPISRGQRGFWWGVRVAASIAMLAFGVGSQTFLLSKPGEPKAPS